MPESMGAGREVALPRIVLNGGINRWMCFTPGRPPVVGFGATPSDAFDAWRRVSERAAA